MATKKCPECAETIQREAKVCKHCGYRFDSPAEQARIASEAEKAKGGSLRFLACVGGAIALLGLFGALSKTPQSPQTVSRATSSNAAASKATASEIEKANHKRLEREAELKREADCRQDVACYGNRGMASAGFDCMEPIQRLAKNNYEWTDGWLDPKLSRIAWSDREKGVVTYFGDKIKFQNGFGAWVIYSYKCVYDVPRSRVVEVTAWPGQL